MKSIRVFLIVALLSTITLGNFLAAMHGYRRSMMRAEGLMDAQIADTAVLIGALHTPGSPRVQPRPSGRLAFQVWSADGTLLARSDNATEDQIVPPEDGYRDANFGGFRWRVLSTVDNGSGHRIVVAERIDIRVELADGIIIQSVLPIVLSLPLVALIVWLVVGKGLSLVTQLAEELSSKRADDLSLLKTADPPRELAAVFAAINDLLRRLDDAVQRERRFSADAAHELRTPLSAIKVHLHNLRGRLTDHDDAIDTLERDVNRLGHLIEQIMLLNRLTPEDYAARMGRVNLCAMAQDVIGDLYARIEGRGQTIELNGASMQVTGDEDSLKILLKNLILNASKYSPTGADIRVDVAAHFRGVSLSVSDTGPGIPLPELNRVLDRFYRVGGDRHDSTIEGGGLGLSIVRHIAELHHANLQLRNNENGVGLTASVVFPGKFDAPGLVGEAP